ncbi:hypothetical protein IJG26_01145 [Candidatus Saccharibacteria bacterium]|nr:hypothetical protein [Candidatus Saccharibacteria bacterium]
MKYKETLVIVIPTILTFVCGVLLSSNYVSADDVVDQINITVPISCTISGTGMNTHNAEINNGTYQANIGTTTLHAFCNDNNGFAIYAAGYTGDEIGGTNSNKLVGTTSSGNATVETGLATSAGNPDVSNWAMKLAITQDSGDTTGTNAYTIDSAPNTSGGTDATFSQYHVVPNEYTKVAHKNSATDMTANTGGVKLTTTYAAYISKTQPADTYSGQVIYTLVHPANHSAPVACKPTGTTIGTNTSTDIQCMQDFASLSSANKATLISNMTEGTQYTLKDKRDGKEYTVAKLADGKVWMTQNLDLDLDSGTTYTNLDTDLGWNTSTNQYDTASWTPSRSTYATTTNNIHAWCQGGTWNTQDGYCEQNNTPESYNPGEIYWNTTTSDWTDWDAYYDSCDYSTSTPSCNESLNPLSTYVSSTGTQQYHLGNYYNWAAAIASNDASVYGYDDEDPDTPFINPEAHQSICPAGWTLPYANYNNSTNQSEGDFANLWTEYGWDSTNDEFSDITDLTGAPLYFTPAGDFNGYLGNVGGGGSFWSSVAYSDYVAHRADFGVNGYADPAGYGGRDYSNSVRCLLRPPAVSFDDAYAENNKTKTNNYYVMQDLDDSICGSVSEGQVTTLIDVRDNNTYHVGKLKDGNCWMLDNLALDPTDSTTAANMNTSNTNASAAAITNLLNGGSTTTGWSNVAVADLDEFDSNAYTRPRISTTNKNAFVTSYGLAATDGQAKVGIYYNYCAATASTYCYEDGNGVDLPDTIIDAPQDICPVGWRMPTGSSADGEYGEYGVLDNLYYPSRVLTNSNSVAYGLSITLSGHMEFGFPLQWNGEGTWWSSTVKNKSKACGLLVSLTELFTGQGLSRYTGHTVRCVLTTDPAGT